MIIIDLNIQNVVDFHNFGEGDENEKQNVQYVITKQ